MIPRRSQGGAVGARALELLSQVLHADRMHRLDAAASRMDAVAYRLRGLQEVPAKDPRAIEVLTRASKMIGWVSRPSPNPEMPRSGPAVGRGIAYMRYKQAENYK